MGFNVSMSEVKKPLKQTMKKYKDTPSGDDTNEETTITKFWDTLQTSFRCCGTDLNDKDGKETNSWEIDGPYPIDTFKVPKSCCARFDKSKVDQCRENPFTFNKSLDENEKVTGCFDKLQVKVDKHKKSFIITGVVLLVIMFLNMLSSFALCTKSGD